MLDKKLGQELLEVLASSGADFCEVFAEKSSSNSIYMEQSKVEKIAAGIDMGVGLRIVKGDSTVYAHSNVLDRDSLLPIARDLSQAFSHSGKLRHTDFSQSLTFTASHVQVLPSSIGMDEKVQILVLMDRAAREVSSRVRQTSLRYADTTQDIYILNSEGLDVRDRRIRSRFMINVIAEQDGMIQTGYEGPGQSRGWEFITSQPLEDIARKAATRAVKMLSATPAPAGRMTVVLGGEAGGTMIHEACGHSLEADFIYKNTSIFNGKVGEQVASPLITVVDDGSLAYEYGYAACDDEGTLTAKNVLIEKGILKQFITDKMSARLLGLPCTGNGRRESYRNKPVPRMSNTYIANGESDPGQILASVADGLYVAKMGGGQVNITNGDFVFEVSEGYLIKNGRLTDMVKGATLTGSGPQVLSSVSGVGNDMSFIPGVCGKSDHVPVSDAQPTLLIPEIIVGGQV